MTHGSRIDNDSSESSFPDNEFVVQEFEHDFDSLWHKNLLLAVATLFGPLGTTAVLLGLAGLVGGIELVRRIVLTALLTFFVLGRFIILSGSGGAEEPIDRFTAAELAMLVFYLDLMTAILISWHVGALFRIPWLGQRLRFLMNAGRDVLDDNRWMRRTTLLAIVAFVMFPLASSGSVGGSLFGRLLGLSRAMTLLGVLIGSALGCGTMYYGATLINRFVDLQNPLIRWGGIAAIMFAILVLNHRYRKARKRHRLGETS